MSYLIHNFAYPHYTTRSSLRTRSLLLVRNIAKLYLFLTLPVSVPSLSGLRRLHIPSWTVFYVSKFTGLAKLTLFKVRHLRYLPIGVNFARSAHYKTTFTLDKTFSTFSTPATTLPFANKAITYPYSLGSYVLITPIANKPFSYTLHLFLKLSIRLWLCLPSSAKTSVHYSILQNEMLYLPFLNKYFFKIYNV